MPYDEAGWAGAPFPATEANPATAATGDAPTGRMFQCSVCDVWSHTECYDDYRGVDDEALPEEMRCHRCYPRGGDVGASVQPSPKRRRAVASPEREHARKRATPSTVEKTGRHKARRAM